MKVFAISDLHLSGSVEKPMDIFGGAWENYQEHIRADWAEKVGEEDLVLLAGDLSWAMNLDQVKTDFSFLQGLKGKKVLIKGNHDYWWNSLSKVRAMLPPDVFVVQNDAVRFGKVLVCGTRGWTCPEEGKPLSEEDLKIYKREIERLRLSLSAMQKLREEGDFVVVMMHYPPFNARRAPNEMTALITEAGVDAVVYGHLHGRECRVDLRVDLNGIPYFLTSCDLTGQKLVELGERERT